MDGTLLHASKAGLEGLCQGVGQGRAAGAAVIKIGRGADGIERVEADFAARAFSPHRHDTYAIGITVRGVQTFRYRGEQRYCCPGQGHILHPDEIHDGNAATEAGFGYRILYIAPALIQQALGGRPLPFVPEPIVRQPDRLEDLAACLRNLDEPIDELERVEMAADLAGLIEALSSPVSKQAGSLSLPAMARVRDLIMADPAARFSVEACERVADLDRWTIARQFRAAFGTSPSRFRTMRQLDQARLLINQGLSLAEAALDAGFADQSHMSRLFKRAYGLTPARWAAALVPDS